MTVYRIRSTELRAKGERFETADRVRALAKLAHIRATLDPDARLLAIPRGK